MKNSFGNFSFFSNRFCFSLRALYGKDLIHNAIEVSPDAAKAKDDIHLLFGDLDQVEQGE